ncbi:MAG TPA: DNA polymerase III subunit gamma/tau [candidate division Zixibacteria bacterium]|nr:DNA polymerase III subunit gamma/tau [candidate division Zixibacteria bacterium]
MSYVVLARKWRPQSFEDIVGQEPIIRTLQNAIRMNRLAHAYLFAGVRGVGKTTAARVLAKALNCERGPTPSPCNDCTPCREIAGGSAIDVLEIDGASNRGIDEVRQIIENARYQPARCRFKIYIIDEVHQVTKEAFNALLKTLEEPPPSVKFILATTEPHRLPETILSRCQRYNFRRISLREIVGRLREIAASERLEITDGALALLAREADGSMRDAQSLLEQVLAFAETGGREEKRPPVDERTLQEVLGLAERSALYEISEAVLRGDAKRCLEMVAKAVALGRDLNRLSKELVEHFRNLLVVRLAGGAASAAGDGAPDDGQLIDLPDHEIAALASQAQSLSADALLDYFEVIAAADEELSRSANARFALEAALVRMATLPQTLPVSELIERLEQLETRLAAASPGGSPPGAEAPAKPLPGATSSSTSIPKATPALQNERLWQEFVAFVGREKKLLASHLAFGNALEIAPGTVTIGVAERHHLSYLQDRENLSLLEKFASRFFAADTVIRLTHTATEGGSRPPSAALPVEDGTSPFVKEALRIFHGEVKTVRREN